MSISLESTDLATSPVLSGWSRSASNESWGLAWTELAALASVATESSAFIDLDHPVRAGAVGVDLDMATFMWMIDGYLRAGSTRHTTSCG